MFIDLRRSGPFFRAVLLAVFGIAVARGQTQDTSGNGLLSGNFAFRHVAVQNVNQDYNPTEVTATYGVIAFDGNGNYSITATSVDNTVSGGAPQPLSVTGTYAIGSNGTGYIANPLYPTDPFKYVYGAVAQGVFTGSSTEVGIEFEFLNDIFVAIPTGAAPTNASFTTSYQAGLLDFSDGGSAAVKNALFELTPNGQGTFGTILLTGQASNSLASSLTQSISGATYSFNSDGSATLKVPLPTGTASSSALFTGNKTIFQSADGNFILGWTPTGYDIFFGVSALTTAAANSTIEGLYFNAGLEDSPASGAGVDSYYGSINNSGDSAGDGIQHERLNFPTFYSFDYGTNDQIKVNANGTTGTDLDGYTYLIGDGGHAYVGIGTSGDFALVVGLHAASFSGTGVYLNPVGVVNAASLQPITASIAPGELIELTGTGLANTSMSMQGGQAFPTQLGGVSVTIDNIPCAVYFVTPTLVSVLVPYELASNETGLANIQVTNNGVASNVVQMYFSDSAPGAFSQSENGIGLAQAEHAATGALVTASNPAQAGETIVLYMTGLGTVTPAVTTGALGPTDPLSYSDLFSAGNLAVFFNDYTADSVGNQGNIAYAGLVPTLAGLYQLNVQVPTSGLGSGDDVYVEFVTDMADVNQIEIPFGAGGPVRRVRSAEPFGIAAHIAQRRAAGQKAQSRRRRSAVTGSCASGAERICVP